MEEPQPIAASVLFQPKNENLRYLPEGPYQLSQYQFSWVAIQHGENAKYGSLNIFNLADKSNVSHDLPGRPGFAFPTTDADVFVIGMEKEVGFFNIKTQEWFGQADCG